jgi:hypothetical protein
MKGAGINGWRRYVVRKDEHLRTTWSFRFALVACLFLLVWPTRHLWTPAVARALVCDQSAEGGDAILVDNFEWNYLLFERAAALRADGVGPRVWVPTDMSIGSDEPNFLSKEIVEAMARVAQLRQPEVIAIRPVEPISLNAAYQIRAVLQREKVRTVVVVTPAFRSRRSSLIYSAVFAEAHITTRCVPVFGQQTPDTWSETWHGILQVAEQHLKLQYYRFYVLPVRLAAGQV